MSTRYTPEPVCGINLRNSNDRLRTFQAIPGIRNVTQLAEHGFYLTGEGDEIQCSYCGIQLNGALHLPLSIILDTHKNSSSKCQGK